MFEYTTNTLQLYTTVLLRGLASAPIPPPPLPACALIYEEQRHPPETIWHWSRVSRNHQYLTLQGYMYSTCTSNTRTIALHSTIWSRQLFRYFYTVVNILYYYIIQLMLLSTYCTGGASHWPVRIRSDQLCAAVSTAAPVLPTRAPNVEWAFVCNESDIVKRTGPRFLSAVLQRYRGLNSSRSRLCDRDPTASPDCVYVAPSHVFESLDILTIRRYFSRCANDWLLNSSAPLILRNECTALLRQRDVRGSLPGEDHSEERFSQHHYLHLGYESNTNDNSRYRLNMLMNGYWTYVHNTGLACIQLL